MKVFAFFFVFTVTITLSSSLDPNNVRNNTDEKELAQQFIKFLEPFKPIIQKWFWDLSGINYYSKTFDIPEGKADFITCEVCTQGLPLVRFFLNSNVSSDAIISALTIACQVLELAPRNDICLPTIKSYADSILYILERRPNMPMGDFCGILNPGCNELSSELTDWSININNAKPPASPRPPPPPSTTSLSKILHFTDIHLDLDYVEGKESNCGLPICCRESDGPPANEDEASGPYGHFKCGLPERGLRAMYDHAKANHQDTKYVFLTGDYVHSGIWLYGVEENSRHISNVTRWLKEAFAETNAEIYPLVGNHEPDVVNMYPSLESMNDFPLTWMYDAVIEPFKDSIPILELETFRKYGYYTVTSPSDKKLRFIIVNTNICYINNFWLPFDAIDTFGQLQWLANTLNLAEQLKQKVFVLGHIHPGSGSCWPVWSNQFNRIINRYEAIIKGQFYGHSHEQDYKLAFEDKTRRPISVSYVGGSGVTDGMNSAYNVYYADGERQTESTWEIINHETYVLQLTESNAAGEARIEKISDAKRDFGLKSMVPEEIFDFINRMVCNDTLFDTYRKVVMKGENTPRYRDNVCNNQNCKAGILGDLFKSNSGDRSYQQEFEEHIRTIDCTKTDEDSSSATKPTQTSFLYFAIVLSLVCHILSGIL